MATAQANVCIDSSRSLSDIPSDSMTCRGRGFLRRKRRLDRLWMAASSSIRGGGGASRKSSASGDDGAGGSRGAPGGRGRRRLYISGRYASGSHELPYCDGADSPATMGGKEGSAESLGSAGAFSSPSDYQKATEGSGRIAFSSDISVARGITMDTVHGSVRSKTPPKVSLFDAPVVSKEATGGGHSSQMPSMVELAAAVEEAAREAPSISPVAGDITESEMDTEPMERMYRATSSAALAQSLFGDETDVPKSKRARSGVFVTESGIVSSPRASAGGAVGWFGDTRPHQISSVSSSIDGMGTISGTESSAEMKEEQRTVGGGGGDSGLDDGGDQSGGDRGVNTAGDSGASAAAAVASGDSPLTNEAWLEMLSPLLSLLRSDTHPEDYLHDLLRERGYSTEMVAVKETAFHRPPHPDQVAAYDKVVLRAVLDDDEAALERMRSSGKRMDSCNRFGDSILHMSCRRGRVGALRYLLRVCPSGVLLTDDFGRTIMHDACWTATPRFDVASTVLDADLRLLRCLDSRGSSPLQYVPQDQWPLWCAFFENRKEIYWPPLAPGERNVHGEIPRADDAASGESA